MWGFDANLNPSVLFCFKSILFLLTFFMWSWRLCTLSCVVELLGSTKRLNINYQDPDGWVIDLLWDESHKDVSGSEQRDTEMHSQWTLSQHFLIFIFISQPHVAWECQCDRVHACWLPVWCIMISFEIDRDKLLGSCWITSAHLWYRLKLNCCKCPI